MKNQENNWSLGIGHWALKKQAFSLIEVIFAMVFLMVIIFGVVSLQSSNLALINTQKNEIQAHFFANQGLQVAEVIGYATIDGLGCTECMLQLVGNNYSALAKGASEGEPINSIFFRHFEVDKTLTDAIVVSMNVDWTDSTGGHTTSSKLVIY
jgi:hypothetical protein